jgi:hypothetical protein
MRDRILQLLLERFGLNAAVLNADLPANSRHSIVMQVAGVVTCACDHDVTILFLSSTATCSTCSSPPTPRSPTSRRLVPASYRYLRRGEGGGRGVGVATHGARADDEARVQA